MGAVQRGDDGGPGLGKVLTTGCAISGVADDSANRRCRHFSSFQGSRVKVVGYPLLAAGITFGGLSRCPD